MTVARIYEVLQHELEEDCEEFDSGLETETETTPSEDSSGTSVLSADLFKDGKDDIIQQFTAYARNLFDRHVKLIVDPMDAGAPRDAHQEQRIE